VFLISHQTSHLDLYIFTGFVPFSAGNFPQEKEIFFVMETTKADGWHDDIRTNNITGKATGRFFR
jgi:hypothetical protein